MGASVKAERASFGTGVSPGASVPGRWAFLNPEVRKDQMS